MGCSWDSGAVEGVKLAHGWGEDEVGSGLEE